MGTPEFAVPSLTRLLNSKHQVIAVVTGTDKPIGRGQKMKPTPIKQTAQSFGISVLTPASLSDPDFIGGLRGLSSDLFVVVAFRILPPAVFTIPPKGTINLHASLLPKYRGAAPIHWAIINGEKKTGVTTFFIEEKVDAGEWILQQKVDIGDQENAGELHDKLSRVGADALLQTVDLIEQGRAPRVKQVGEVTKAPKLSRELCRIKWTDDAQRINNLIRGLSPYPQAFSILNGEEIKICRSHVEIDTVTKTGQPGEILGAMKDRILVCAADGVLAITELQPENRRRMTAAEYLLGHPLTAGDRFE